MTGLDADGLDDLARSLASAADELRLEAGRCSRALAGLGWSSGVAERFSDVAVGATRRAGVAADDLDHIAAGLRRQAEAVRHAAATAARLAGEAWHDLGAAAHQMEDLAGDAWHVVGGLL